MKSKLLVITFVLVLIYSKEESLKQLVKKDLKISDIIETHLATNDPNFWNFQSKINQKHIDFLLVSRIDTTPLLAIELDGGSHTDKQRLKRDAIVDSVFHNAGIPILHIPVKGFYQYNDLRSAIETAIKGYKVEPGNKYLYTQKI